VTPNCPKPPHSFVMGEPRDFKFGTLIYHSKSHPADEKSSLKGAWSGSGDPFLNFTLYVIYPHEIQIGFTFLVPAHLGSRGQRAVKRVCVCVCVCARARARARTRARVRVCVYNISATANASDFKFCTRVCHAKS